MKDLSSEPLKKRKESQSAYSTPIPGERSDQREVRQVMRLLRDLEEKQYNLGLKP